MWRVILKLGRLRFTILVTVFSVASSVAMTSFIDRVMHRPLPLSGLIAAVSVPLFLSPLCTWVILGLLFEIQRMREEVLALATYDHLTGVFTRRALLEISNQYFEIAKRENKEIAVLYIDIDHFKKINDGYGHAGGDVVLRTVAAAIGGAIRKSDILGRQGGDEFVITLLNVGEEGALTVAERIRKLVAQGPISIGEHSFSTSVSIGIAVSRPGVHKSLDDLINEADKALYVSKNGGRNRSTVYSAELAQPSASHP